MKESDVQPIPTWVSFFLDLQSQFHWSFFIGTWQQRPRALDYQWRFEIEEIALRMQSAVFRLIKWNFANFICWTFANSKYRIRKIIRKLNTSKQTTEQVLANSIHTLNFVGQRIWKNKQYIRTLAISWWNKGWQSCIGCLKLQFSFRIRAKNYRVLLWKMTWIGRHFMQLCHHVFKVQCLLCNMVQ